MIPVSSLFSPLLSPLVPLLPPRHHVCGGGKETEEPGRAATDEDGRPRGAKRHVYLEKRVCIVVYTASTVRLCTLYTCILCAVYAKNRFLT